MYLISDQTWREAVKLLTAFKHSRCDRNDTREVNRRRRAGILVKKLLKSKKQRNGNMD